MNTHLTDDELIDRLYGIGSNPHRCPECDTRLRGLAGLRRRIAPEIEVSADFLAGQRRSIYARIEAKSRWYARPLARWAPATAAVLCLAAGLAVFHASAPAPRAIPHPAARVVSHAAPHGDPAADAQLFFDVYSMEQSAEPRAAAPIHELFEEN